MNRRDFFDDDDESGVAEAVGNDEGELPAVDVPDGIEEGPEELKLEINGGGQALTLEDAVRFEPESR